MKYRICLLGIFFLASIESTLGNEGFSGDYQISGADVAVQLRLEQSGAEVSGALLAEGLEYQVQGRDEGGRLAGQVTGYGEAMNLNAWFEGDGLIVTMSAINPSAADQGVQSLRFVRADAGAAVAAGPNAQVDPGQGAITINGRALSADELAGLVATYNVQPLPGDYWYDTHSGLYGVVGYQAFGFMLPGHQFGALQANVSNGNTGVFVNGRHLPQPEWLIWSQLLGYAIQQGRYWLDGQGNAGYEGNPVPADNLYVAAQRNAYGGAGGGGDNQWSTRFSAGNYDQGGSRGYVSVPGYGPIGYGF
jgi:hypothetical protein